MITIKGNGSIVLLEQAIKHIVVKLRKLLSMDGVRL